MLSEQLTLVCLEDLVPAGHQYRKFVKIFAFEMVESKLKGLERDDKYKGYGIMRLFNARFELWKMG